MTDASRIGALVVGLAVLVFAGVVSPVFFLPAGAYGDLSTALTWQVVDALLAAGVAYAGLVAVVRRRGVPGVALLVAVGIGLAARLVIVTAPPVLSTDLYRYVWDGRVQAAGISPYRYVPADSALERLRDAGAGPTAIYPNINRAETAPTIYPPAAQMLFAAIGVTASSIWTMKGVMLALDVLAGVFAWRLLRAAGRPEAWVLVWALNPLVIREFAGAGHVDAASLAASGAALLLAARRRPGWAGGGARRGDHVQVAAGGAGAGDLAAARVAGAGGVRGDDHRRVRGLRVGRVASVRISGGVRGRGGVVAGRRLPAVAAGSAGGALPHWVPTAYKVAALLLLGGLAIAIIARRAEPRADVLAWQAVLLSLSLLVVLTPHYPWYITMAVLPAVVAPGWGALWPSVAGPLLYLDYGLSDPWWPAVVYLPAMVWLAVALRKGTEYA